MPNLAESKKAFLQTASTNLTRLTAREPFVFVEPGGDVQATVLTQRLGKGEGEGRGGALLVRDSLRHLGERHTVIDRDEVPVFYVERYLAATSAYSVFAPDGEPLAVYICDEPFVVRDGTSAPVARLQSVGNNRVELVEAGGGTIAQFWPAPLPFRSFSDDQWCLTVFGEPAVLDRRAVVACPLVALLLWSPAL